MKTTHLRSPRGRGGAVSLKPPGGFWVWWFPGRISVGHRRRVHSFSRSLQKGSRGMDAGGPE